MNVLTDLFFLPFYLILFLVLFFIDTIISQFTTIIFDLEFSNNFGKAWTVQVMTLWTWASMFSCTGCFQTEGLGNIRAGLLYISCFSWKLLLWNVAEPLLWRAQGRTCIFLFQNSVPAWPRNPEVCPIWLQSLWTGSSPSCVESPSCEQIHLEVTGEVRDKKGFLHVTGRYYTRLWTNVADSKCFQIPSLYKHAKFGGVPKDCQAGKIVRIHMLGR